MDAGPDDVVCPRFELEWPLGASRSSVSGLGPISPELVLVDPVLAERARQLLPEPRERPGPPRGAPAPERPVVGPPEKADRPPVEAQPAPPRRRRWRRTVVLAGLVFAAGAAAGGFLGERHSSSSRGTPEAEDGSPTGRATATGAATQPPRREPTTTERPAPQAPKTAEPSTTSTPRLAAKVRPARRVAWAANVLGVSARVARAGVELVWQRPADSGRVVVVRARGARRHGAVVFNGRATRYRDASARPCATYRYTIVNYDRRGHPSTGVPTSVVTACS